MTKSISIEGVSKWYGEGDDRLVVIDDISEEVSSGEFVAIVGPSGCGKTTLLEMIDGWNAPSAGDVYIDDELVTGPLKDVAMVFQNFELFPWRTVYENVELGLEIRGVDEEERRKQASKWIDTVGLSNFGDNYIHELSGGMQQRVGLARALVIEPDVLLMDEPFGSLDAQTKETLQNELLQLLNEQDATIVFVTHDIQEAIFLADRVLVMGSKPSSFIEEYVIDLPRPRWKERTELENSDEFGEYTRNIRSELGLTGEIA